MNTERISVASKALAWVDRDKSYLEYGVGEGNLRKSRALIDMVGQLTIDGAVVPQTTTNEAIQRARLYMAQGEAHFGSDVEMSDHIKDLIYDLNEKLGGGLIKR